MKMEGGVGLLLGVSTRQEQVLRASLDDLTLIADSAKD